MSAYTKSSHSKVRRSSRVLGGAIAVAIALLLTTAESLALEYSSIDRATLRVFSFKGVAVVQRDRDGSPVPVAVPDAGHGTGVLVEGAGLVLTAKHVVEGARLLAVQFQGTGRAVPARLVYTDPAHDLAWLAVAGPIDDFVEIVEPEQPLAVRSKIFVIGYPLDAKRSNPQSQSGVISGERPDGLLQLAVALNPGNSGGPVIGESGQLLGIAIAGADPRRGAQGIGVAVPVEQIRQSLAEVRQGYMLEKASAELSTHRAQDLERATILSALMTSDGVVEGLHLRADADEKDGAAFWNALKHSVQSLGAESPELILLAAARHFNNAVWRRQGGSSSWASAMQTARTLVERAVGYDPNLGNDEFVKLVLQNSQSASYAKRTPVAGGNLDSMESSVGEDDDELLLGDLTAKRRLPMFGIGPTMFSGYQTQLFGLGVAGWLYFEKAFHLYYRYAYGVTLASGRAHFAEAYAGFPVSTSRDATSVKLIVNADYQPGVAIYSYVTRSIPDVSVWLAEAGIYVSPIDYFYCDQACRAEDVIIEEDDDTAEVATLAAGVRYRYFYYASGPGLLFNARQHVDVALHALAFGFGVPESEDLYNSFTEAEMKASTVGVRASAAGVLAPWFNLPVESSVGFLPANSTFFVTVGGSFYLH